MILLSKVVNFVKANPTALYTVLATALPLATYFGLNFDQDKVLGAVASLITLLTGVVVRKVNLNTTEAAKADVPEGYVAQSDVFPSVDYTLPGNDMSAVDQAEGVSL
jgi:hypothetical protein